MVFRDERVKRGCRILERWVSQSLSPPLLLSTHTHPCAHTLLFCYHSAALVGCSVMISPGFLRALLFGLWGQNQSNVSVPRVGRTFRLRPARWSRPSWRGSFAS